MVWQASMHYIINCTENILLREFFSCNINKAARQILICTQNDICSFIIKIAVKRNAKFLFDHSDNSYFDIRLRDWGRPWRGRVEVLYDEANYNWGSLCEINVAAAQVICRQLGFFHGCKYCK